MERINVVRDLGNVVRVTCFCNKFMLYGVFTDKAVHFEGRKNVERVLRRYGYTQVLHDSWAIPVVN
jgi:hypothetical protein